MTNQITSYQKIKSQLRKPETVETFSEIIGNSNAGAYISSVLLAVRNNEKLQECTISSILTSAVQAATLRLSCDPQLGQAHLVPFKDKATLIIGWKGLNQLALRTNQYRIINVATVWAGQEVVEDQLTGFHSINGAKKESKPIGYMLYFELVNGYRKTFYMTVEEIEAHGAKYSRSYKYDTSIWKTDFAAMAKKTVLRLGLSRWGYFDPNDAAVMSTVDEAGPDVIDGTIIEPDEEIKLIDSMGNDIPDTEEELMKEMGF